MKFQCLDLLQWETLYHDAFHCQLDVQQTNPSHLQFLTI
jgi:hypothetical protein